MTIFQIYNKKNSTLSEIRSSIEEYLITKINANQKIFESLIRIGTPYGGNVLPTGYSASSMSTQPKWSYNSTYSLPSQSIDNEPLEPGISNRFSVVYLLNEQYKNLDCPTSEQAKMAIQVLLDDKDRKPMGIYDDKTELFDWEHSLREEYEKASMREQGRRGEEIINITKALRRRIKTRESGEFRNTSPLA